MVQPAKRRRVLPADQLGNDADACDEKEATCTENADASVSMSLIANECQDSCISEDRDDVPLDALEQKDDLDSEPAALPEIRVERLSETPMGKALNQVTNCDQFVEVDKVPIIDLQPWYDGTEVGRQTVVGELRFACEKVGFFLIRNHGLPDELISSMFDATKRYFDQPRSEKTKIPMSKDYPYGYESKEVLVRSEDGENTSGKAPPAADMKETFTVCLGPEENVHPTMPSCRWPEAPDNFKPVLTAYYRACEHVLNELLKAAALALDMPEDFFEDKVDRHIAALRTLNYPDTRSSPPCPGQFRASPHTDYGTFTLLTAGANPDGLQVMKKGGDWLDVVIPPDCLTVNVGDMLCRWTNDRWRSTRHRVVVKEGELGNRRQSVAFFHNPNPDAMVQTLPSCVSDSQPDKYNDVKSGDYLMMKHFSAMGYA